MVVGSHHYVICFVVAELIGRIIWGYLWSICPIAGERFLILFRHLIRHFGNIVRLIEYLELVLMRQHYLFYCKNISFGITL